eukprot:1195087-Prorocentrum_minimum.AAC.3
MPSSLRLIQRFLFRRRAEALLLAADPMSCSQRGEGAAPRQHHCLAGRQGGGARGGEAPAAGHARRRRHHQVLGERGAVELRGQPRAELDHGRRCRAQLRGHPVSGGHLLQAGARLGAVGVLLVAELLQRDEAERHREVEVVVPQQLSRLLHEEGDHRLVAEEDGPKAPDVHAVGQELVAGRLRQQVRLHGEHHPHGGPHLVQAPRGPLHDRPQVREPRLHGLVLLAGEQVAHRLGAWLRLPLRARRVPLRALQPEAVQRGARGGSASPPLGTQVPRRRQLELDGGLAASLRGVHQHGEGDGPVVLRLRQPRELLREVPAAAGVERPG